MRAQNHADLLSVNVKRIIKVLGYYKHMALFFSVLVGKFIPRPSPKKFIPIVKPVKVQVPVKGNYI